MRRLALLALVLLLPGCTGFDTFVGHTFGPSNPNRPPPDSETSQRVMGTAVAVKPLEPEPGNVWPSTPAPEQSLLNLMPENQQVTVPSQGVVLGTKPLPALPPAPATPQRNVPSTGYGTSAGPAPVTGSRPGYDTVAPPASPGNAIVVPNGNGTSTVIYPDGRVETVPTPK